MPPVIIAVAYYAAVMTTAAWIAMVLTTVAYGISQYQASRARRAARDSYNAGLRDRFVMTATVDQARTRCYGRVRNVDGVVFKATRGDKKQFYTLVIALCGHEIDGVEKVYFGDTELTLDGLGSVMTAPWSGTQADTQQESFPAGATSHVLAVIPDSGSVNAMVESSDGDQVVAVTVVGSTVTFPDAVVSLPKRVVYQTTSTSTRAQVRVYNGGSGQDLSHGLAVDFPDLIVPGAHRFAGMACLRVDLAYDQDAFPQGVPNPITAVFRGAKVYDPRTGVTAWTENPALIARDWALYANGGASQVSDIVPEDFVAAANACDVTHAFKSVNGSGSEVTTTRPMYTCGIVCNTSANPLETMSAICETMAGDFAWPGGKLSVRAGAYVAPTGSISADWLSDKGPIEMVKDAPRADLINVIIPSISNAENRYIVAPVPRVEAPAYIDADGEEYPIEVQYEGITDSDHAAHVASVTLKEARAAKTYTLPCNLRALQCKVGQNWTVDIPEIGLASEVMRVVGWKLDFEQSCVFLTLKATSAAIFDPDESFKRDDALPNSALPDPFTVPQVTGLAMQSGTAQLLAQSDGTIVSRVLVSWDAPSDEAVLNGGAVEIRYGTFDAGPDEWSIVTVPGSDTQVYITGVEDLRYYCFMARFRNKLVAGKWGRVVLHQVLGKTVAPVPPSGLSLSVVAGAMRIRRTRSTELDWAACEMVAGASPGTGAPVPADVGRDGADWLWPPTGWITVWARDVDSSGQRSSWVSASINVDSAVLLDAGNIDPPADWLNANTQWSQVNGRPKTFVVRAWGASASNAPSGFSAGIYNGDTGAELVGLQRSYVVAVFRRDGTLSVSQTYDVYGEGAVTSGRGAAAMAAALNHYATSADYRNEIVVVYSYDEPFSNRLASGLLAAMLANGASRPNFEKRMKVRGAYILVGVAGCGEGNGAELVAGDIDADPDAWCELAFQLGAQGSLFITAGNSSPRTVVDLGYIGDLDATKGAPAGTTVAGQAAEVLVADAATAKATATSAAANASSALATLATMRSNGYIDAAEKTALIKEVLALRGEYSGILAQADVYGITTERAAYVAKKGALETYLGSLSPAWDNTTTDTPITPATDQTVWNDFYQARQTLLNKVSDEAGKRAQWALVGGDGKPLDYAGLVIDLGDGGGYGQRQFDDPPSFYVTPGKYLQFKQSSSISLPGAAEFWATLETTKQYYTDGGGGKTTQYAYSGTGTWRRTATSEASSATWTAWVADLDRNNYSGALDATRNRVFRQSTDPGGAAVDGDIWHDTSTGGKSWVRVSGAWSPNVSSGSVGTGELGNQAATEITQDTIDLGGAQPGVGEANYVYRSVTVTPPVASVVNYTMTVVASGVYPDAGNYMGWYVSVGGGADTFLASVFPENASSLSFSGKQAAAGSFSAAASVSLVFKLMGTRSGGGGSPRAWASSMRIEVIKR